MDHQGAVTFDDAVAALESLARAHFDITGQPLKSVVIVGGTALAAHAIRERSEDVDVYASAVDDEAVRRAIDEHASRLGRNFKLDVTPSNTLWGAIALADIEASPVVKRLSVGANTLEIRALSIETLYLVKAAANRAKDQADLRALASRSDFDSLVARAKQIFPWYADRGLFPAYCERLIRYVANDFGRKIADVELAFGLREAVLVRVHEIRRGMEAQFTGLLRAAIKRRPDLVSFDPKTPEMLFFDASGAGLAEEVVSVANASPRATSDMAAAALREFDQRRHGEWMQAILKARRQPGETQ